MGPLGPVAHELVYQFLETVGGASSLGECDPFNHQDPTGLKVDWGQVSTWDKIKHAVDVAIKNPDVVTIDPDVIEPCMKGAARGTDLEVVPTTENSPKEEFFQTVGDIISDGFEAVFEFAEDHWDTISEAASTFDLSETRFFK